MKIQRGGVAAIVAAVWLLVPLSTQLFGMQVDAPTARDRVLWGLAFFGYLVIGSAVAAWGGVRVGHAVSRSEVFAIMAAGAAVLTFWLAIV